MAETTADTQIPVSSELRDRLRACKRGGDRYDDVLRRMLEQYDPDTVSQTSDVGETSKPASG